MAEFFLHIFRPVACGLLLIMALGACRSAAPPPDAPGSAAGVSADSDPIAALIAAAPAAEDSARKSRDLEKMGFSIQVGAFSLVRNAVRFEQSLDRNGLDAYYFRDPDGLFKVRFGNHSSYAAARRQAQQLQHQGLIGSFFIVLPESYPAAQIHSGARGNLRDELVKTASNFIGVPYLWGGETRNGFDCSGLTMVCYRLNGLNLPRNSRAQYQHGRRISQPQLQKGDLVFFATRGGSRITHVGMYIGEGRFIHAPRTGKTVRIAKLSSSYWQQAFRGGRSYL